MPVAPADTGARREADKDVDARWGAFQGWLAAMMSLPKDALPEYDTLKALEGLLFSEGLTFLTYTYELEWLASQSRLSVIDDRYQAAVAAVGGGTLLEALRQAHAAYGRVLGISAEPTPAPSIDTRAPKAAAADAVRRYVARVVCWPDARAPERQEVADRLIRPLTGWDDGRG